MIDDFIYTGSFNDPYKEFFIEKLYKLELRKPDEFILKLTSDHAKIPSFIGN